MNPALRQFGGALALGIAVAANADTIQATSAGLEVAETRYALNADFRLDLSASLLEALNNGLSLGFLVEFELSRPRWYWFDEKTATEKLELRLAYLPLAQHPAPRMVLLVRTDGDPAQLVQPVKDVVRALDPNMPMLQTMTYAELYRYSLVEGPGVAVKLVGTLGAVGLLLAIAGLYGVVAYNVSRRTREIGIRMAIGARANDIMLQFLVEAVVLALIGGIAGCAVGAWLTLWMSYDWPIVVGGKPVGSIPPYVIIMFEMTILFGALSTILGILFNAAFAARRAGTIQYDERFTNDRFGIFVPVEAGKAAPIESLLKQSGAEEVHRG